ncbi:VOC family protein [Streptomyces sp. NPDC002643]
MSISPVRLNHAVLFVADVTRSERFYTSVFGMDVTERFQDQAVFLRLPDSVNDHDLGLMSVGPSAPPKRRGGIGLYHLAWQVDTIEKLQHAREVLAEAGAYTGESSHNGIAKSLYGADPDGNEFEILWMLPRDQWDAYATTTPVEPLDLAAEASRWSGIQTAGEIR